MHSTEDIKNSVGSLVGDENLTFFLLLKRQTPHQSANSFMMFCVLQSHCDMHIFNCAIETNVHNLIPHWLKFEYIMDSVVGNNRMS